LSLLCMPLQILTSLWTLSLLVTYSLSISAFGWCILCIVSSLLVSLSNFYSFQFPIISFCIHNSTFLSLFDVVCVHSSKSLFTSYVFPCSNHWISLLTWCKILNFASELICLSWVQILHTCHFRIPYWQQHWRF
jgi:hypothetical protein